MSNDDFYSDEYANHLDSQAHPQPAPSRYYKYHFDGVAQLNQGRDHKQTWQPVVIVFGIFAVIAFIGWIAS